MPKRKVQNNERGDKVPGGGVHGQAPEGPDDAEERIQKQQEDPIEVERGWQQVDASKCSPPRVVTDEVTDMVPYKVPYDVLNEVPRVKAAVVADKRTNERSDARVCMSKPMWPCLRRHA